MFKKLVCIFTFVALFYVPPVFSHADHMHYGDKDIIEMAPAIAEQLVDFDVGLGFGKLDTSWRDLPANVVNIYKKGEGYYIVSIFNAAENKSLFLLISVEGELYDANFSGQFPKIRQMESHLN